MASTVRDKAGGSVIGFAIVFVSFVFRGLVPAPSWFWLVVLAAGVLLAVKDGISGLTSDIATFAMSCTPGSDPWSYKVYVFGVGRASLTLTAKAPEPNYPGEYAEVTISAETRLHRAMPR
jgi:hypothetical protein